MEQKTGELELKLQLKRLGDGQFKTESRELVRQADMQFSRLDASNKADKKKNKAINKDKAVLEKRIAKTAALLAEIGGRLTEDRQSG